MDKKKSSPSVTQKVSGDNNVVVGGDVNGNIIVGDNNTVNQTIIQKFFNIFKSDAETVDQRNRRIMLGHVENFWVKGILEKSLHGAALLDLGIKEDPDALNYPWAIKREANKETLPEGTSMLEIFQEIGLGRSLLILGAPGSGKTTMLLELTRQLIERAREDVTEPIPVVFNLSSWTKELTIADWLARELNVIYTIPRKVAPTWVAENKMLLLLDGLDEVKQESRDKCVDAINQFRKENGLTSMAVCSRIQDYAELKTRLSFDGAIEIQQLTANQVDEYFIRFGKGLAGIQQVLEKDVVLHEMAETPLFLSIMTLAYRDIQSKDILVSETVDKQRKHLFDTYIERMFERPARSKNDHFEKEDILHWLSWLAKNMIEYNQVPYLLENMQPKWLRQKKQGMFLLIVGLIASGLSFGLYLPFYIQLIVGEQIVHIQTFGLTMGMIAGVIAAMIGRFLTGKTEIKMVDTLAWDWKKGLSWGLIGGLLNWVISLIGIGVLISKIIPISLVITGAISGLMGGLKVKPIIQTTNPGQKIAFSIRNSFFVLLSVGLSVGLLVGWSARLYKLGLGLNFGLISGLIFGVAFGGRAVIQHYLLRIIIAFRNLLPWRLIPFLNYCTDLIFLRRVGGGYIFVHRLLMEHFAAMYKEEGK